MVDESLRQTIERFHREHPSQGIDVTLNEMIDETNLIRRNSLIVPIQFWRWHGVPGPFSSKANVPISVDLAIFEVIKAAGAVACFVSESEYVREASKWAHNNPQAVPLKVNKG